MVVTSMVVGASEGFAWLGSPVTLTGGLRSGGEHAPSPNETVAAQTTAIRRRRGVVIAHILIHSGAQRQGHTVREA